MSGSKLSTNKSSIKLSNKSSNKSSNNSTTSHTPTKLNEEQPQPQPQDEVSKYIMSLTEQEKKTLNIAKSHLGTSFNIKKSIGFLDWKSKQF